MGNAIEPQNEGHQNKLLELSGIGREPTMLEVIDALGERISHRSSHSKMCVAIISTTDGLDHHQSARQLFTRPEFVGSTEELCEESLCHYGKINFP